MTDNSSRTFAGAAPELLSPRDEPFQEVWRPSFFRLSKEDDRRSFKNLLSREAYRPQIFDTFLLQVRDLIKSRHPSRKLTVADIDSLIPEYLRNSDPGECGVWVHYPWSGRLVHILDAVEFAELRTDRNRNKVTTLENQALLSKRVGVVGLSVGQAAALTLTLERSFGEIRLADFDSIELSNLNRIRTGVHNLNVPKVYTTAREIAEIDPFLKVVIFPQGVTPDNVDVFLTGGGNLDVVIEECDSLDIKVLVRHHAQRLRIPVVMDTSDRGMLDIERFDLEPDRPIFHGLPGTLDPSMLSGLTTEQKIPFVLKIVGAQTMSPRLRASMLEIDQTISTWPQLASAVAHGGAAAADATRRIMLGQACPSGRYFLDLDPAESTTPHGRYSPVQTREDRKVKRCSDTLLRDLVSEAILAPSGGNTQPWRWVARKNELQLLMDRTRASGLMDFQDRAAFLALGCAAETLIFAAHAAGCEAILQPFPHESNPDLAATFQIIRGPSVDAEPHWRDELHSQIRLRRTQRGLTTREPLPTADLEILTDAVRSIDSCDIQWLLGEDQISEIGELVGIVDRLRILHPQLHHEMYRELRWSDQEAEATRDGIDVATLDISPSDLAGLELCRHWPSLELVRQWGGGRNLEKMSRKAIASASAVGLITVSKSLPIDYFTAGRAVQRMWLAATEKRLAVHPMASLPYFLARLSEAGGRGFDPATIEELAKLRVPYKRLFPITESMAGALLFRIGFGNSESKRSLRRPVDAVLSSTEE
jgi:molybdopterin/thiamine biosynthesis adenylyltransferase